MVAADDVRVADDELLLRGVFKEEDIDDEGHPNEVVFPKSELRGKAKKGFVSVFLVNHALGADALKKWPEGRRVYAIAGAIRALRSEKTGEQLYMVFASKCDEETGHAEIRFAGEHSLLPEYKEALMAVFCESKSEARNIANSKPSGPGWYSA